MIDKQSEVFTRVMNGVIAERADLTESNFSSDLSDAPPTFPHISIVQSDSVTAVRYEDNDFVENKATLTFDINVYSNLTAGKRDQCRQILNDIDKYMLRMNFTRMGYGFAPNLNNNAIARLVAKYQVIADENIFYRIGR